MDERSDNCATPLSMRSDTSSSDSLVQDARDFIEPMQQDLLLTDVTEDVVYSNIGPMLGVEYLASSHVAKPSFPVRGCLYGNNNRIMVNLLCRKKVDQRALNVIFLVDTGSPVTYICEKAMSKLVGLDHPITKQMNIIVHGDTVVECHLSPVDKHFHDVNVLGMDAVAALELSIIIDKRQRAVELQSGFRL